MVNGRSCGNVERGSRFARGVAHFTARLAENIVGALRLASSRHRGHLRGMKEMVHSIEERPGRQGIHQSASALMLAVNRSHGLAKIQRVGDAGLIQTQKSGPARSSDLMEKASAAPVATSRGILEIRHRERREGSPGTRTVGVLLDSEAEAAIAERLDFETW